MPFSLASTQHLAPAMTLVASHGLQAIQGHLPPILSASASYRAAERAPRQEQPKHPTLKADAGRGTGSSDVGRGPRNRVGSEYQSNQ